METQGRPRILPTSAEDPLPAARELDVQVRQSPRAVDFQPSAASARDRFRPTVDRWRASVAGVTDDQLDTIGFSQYPYGSAPHDPFVGVLSGSNLEFIHHMAEIALLRDLWRACPDAASQS
jgi:hypothetical protein